MLVIEDRAVVSTPSGSLTLHTFRPVTSAEDTSTSRPSLSLPGLVVFTEIYQVTGPVSRLCKRFAGEGYYCVSPESYHEFVEAGKALEYNEEGTALGNELKVKKSVQGYDDDARAAILFLKEQGCPRIGSIGMCLGGHLAVSRNTQDAVCDTPYNVMYEFLSRVTREGLLLPLAVSFFATDIQGGTLGEGGDDTLKRIGQGCLRNEVLFIWGRQDTHVDKAGRDLIKATLDDAGTHYSWIEVNAQHAFIRDEYSKGRYDPAITECALSFAFELFHRRLVLGLGDLRDVKGKSGGPQQC